MKWDSDYEPAIRATRAEAPACSRAALVSAPRFGRKVHLLSSAEVAIFFLAMYHPRLVNLHEQRMLPLAASPHPWSGRPEAAMHDLKPMKGTVAVAARLGLLDKHATFRKRKGRHFEHVPFPYIGDLLLFLIDEVGPYCVNWTCKDRHAAFNDRRPDIPIPRNAAASESWALFRHALERDVYQDAGIRTQRCAKEDIPEHLRFNLRNLYTHSVWDVDYSQQRRSDIVGALQTGMDLGVPPNEVIIQIGGGDRQEFEKHRLVLFQAIASRQLRVDLLRPIVMSERLHPERIDVFKQYSSWYSR